MASAIASLRVLLGLDAAEYTRGLTRAEGQARSFSTNVRKAILDVGAALGSLQIGREIFEATKAIIGEASALNDLADATGSSVEALSKLNNQAKIAGTDLATMQSAVLKLSQNLAGADDESQKATQALKLLGITTRDPAQAMQEIALKLNTYEDGVNKVALAVALFGRQGAALLPTLKDIANLQDVGATVTKKQAEEAEKLEQSWRRLSVESEAFKNGILSNMVPALNVLIERMNVGIKAAGSFGQGLEAMFAVSIRPGAVADQLGQVESALKRLKDEAKRGKFELFPGAREETLNSLEAQKQIILKARQQRALANAVFSADDANPRDILMMRKPAAPGLAGGGGGGRAKEIREQQSATDSYIKSLEKQLQSSLDLNIVETAEVEIYNLMQNALSGMTAERAAYIRDIAQQLQFTKDAEEASKALAKARKEESDEVQRRVDASRRANEQAQQEIDSIRGAVEQINLQILAMMKGEKAVDEYNAAKREQIALEKERAATLAEAEGDFALAAKYREAAAALRDLNKATADFRGAEKFAEETRRMQEVKNALSDTFADAMTDFVMGTKTAKEAFNSLVNSILQQLTRVATQNLANSLFGGMNQGGPDFFSLLGKVAGLFGGGGTSGGLNLSSYGPAFANGGTSQGGFAMVGERGPELVNLPSGARVYSTAESKKMLTGGGGTVVQNFVVPHRADTQTIRQQAKAGYRAASGAARRG